MFVDLGSFLEFCLAIGRSTSFLGSDGAVLACQSGSLILLFNQLGFEPLMNAPGCNVGQTIDFFNDRTEVDLSQSATVHH